MYQIEPETDETLARDAGRRKRGRCCLGCAGLLMLFFIISLFCIEPTKETAKRTACGNHEKAIMLGLHVYYDCCKSLLPAYSTDQNGKPLHSWRVLILPYIEQSALYEQIRLDEPWDSEYNQQFHDKMPSAYHCLSARDSTRKSGLTSYMRVVGPGTTTDGPDMVSFDEVKAHLSKIVALVEVYPTVNWMAPVDISPDELAEGINRKKKLGIGSFHIAYRDNTGIFVGMLDGSSQFVLDADVPALAEKAIVPKE